MVVAKLDRLTRSIRDCAQLIEEHFGEKREKRLFSVEESIDTRKASGRLVLNVIMTVAQWEREVIAERTRDRCRRRSPSGQRVGKVRFGYDLADDGKTLVGTSASKRNSPDRARRRRARPIESWSRWWRISASTRKRETRSGFP